MAVSEKEVHAQSLGRSHAAREAGNQNPFPPGSPSWYSYERGYTEAVDVYENMPKAALAQ